MSRPLRLAAAVAAFLLPAGLARAADPPMPDRRPGLWLQSMTVGGQPMEMRACIDAASDRKMWDQGLRMGSQDCSRRDVVKTAGGYTLDLVCSFSGHTMTGHGIITPSGDTAFHMELQSRIDPPFPGLPPAQSVAMDGRWSGPCPADMRPGDMILPGGMRMNVDRLPGR